MGYRTLTDKSHRRIHAGAQIPSGVDFRSAVRLTRTAERGLLDFVLADDFTVLAALATVTERIGLVAAINTTDTTDTTPFEAARRLATLDHLSGGRTGWRIGSEEASEEFVAVVTAFWDSWAPGAVIADRDTGRYVDPDRIRAFEHRGPRFGVRGVATLPARQEGYPPLVQDFSDRRDDNSRIVLSPDGLDEFVDTQVPLLQQSGRFRTEYAGRTLREHLGL